MSNLLSIGLIVVFFIMVVYTTITISSVAAPSDAKEQVSSAIITITSVNCIMAAILGFLAYLQIRSNPSSFQTYMMVMLHVNLVIVLCALSIQAIQKFP